MKLEQLFEDRKKVVDELKSKKKEKHNKESKMKAPPQPGGYEMHQDTTVDEIDGSFL